MNIIQKIEIRNVKGTDFRSYTLQNFNMNQIHVIIAKNGFGKSTLSTAFDSITSKGIELDSENKYKGEDKIGPSVKIEYYVNRQKKIGLATEDKNSIKDNFDVSVLKNPVVARGVLQKFGGFNNVKANLNINDITVVNTIPAKKKGNYSVTDYKEKTYGNKNFRNVEEIILSNLDLIIVKSTLFKKITSLINNQKKIVHIYDEIKSLTKKETETKFAEGDFDDLINKGDFKYSIEIIKTEFILSNKLSTYDLFFLIVQISIFITENSSNLSAILKSYNYQKFKKELDQTLELYNTTGRRLKTIEKKRSLIFSMNSAVQYSYGERDLLYFLVSLFSLKYKLSSPVGKQQIVLIDEVFDYLDGSNMMVVHYHLSELVRIARLNGNGIYPIILTHLDPGVFNNYNMNKHKFHHLEIPVYRPDDNMVELVKLRNDTKQEDCEKFEQISSNYLHFNPQNVPVDFSETKLEGIEFMKNSFDFYEKISIDLDKYLNKEEYCPLSVIISLRVKIEMFMYNRLNLEDRKGFILTHKTQSSP